MDECVFCKIIGGDIPSNRFYEDDDIIVIADIAPHAKKHYLAIPKKHYKFISEMNDADLDVLRNCFKTIAKIAPELGLENGTQDGSIRKQEYYIVNKKIYAKRYDTACFADIFARAAAKTPGGVDTYPTYQDVRASLTELREQNSYFVKEIAPTPTPKPKAENSRTEQR